jgi:uncharacterized linocin/CFP29 family protein
MANMLVSKTGDTSSNLVTRAEKFLILVSENNETGTTTMEKIKRATDSATD